MKRSPKAPPLPAEKIPRADLDEARMEEFGAHLERGWDQLEAGHFDGAELAAVEANRLVDDTPEVHTLRGSIAAARGDTSGALALFEKAMALDPEFVDPILSAAELYVDPLEDFDEALRLCEQALEVAEEEDEYLDALLLKADVEAQMGDEDAARATLAELPPSDFPAPQHHFLAGRVFFDLGDLDAAEKHFKQTLSAEPKFIDALHAMGLVHEDRGDVKKMVQAFIKVREADLKEDAPPFGVTRERFEKLAEEALGELPERIRTLLENVPILAADYPALELVAEGSDPRMMGFFSGIPWPEKSTVSGTPPHLDCVFLYQRNIERYARNADEVEQEIRKTLLHETGHFFGLDEDELEAMGLG